MPADSFSRRRSAGSEYAARIANLVGDNRHGVVAVSGPDLSTIPIAPIGRVDRSDPTEPIDFSNARNGGQWLIDIGEGPSRVTIGGIIDEFSPEGGGLLDNLPPGSVVSDLGGGALGEFFESLGLGIASEGGSTGAHEEKHEAKKAADSLKELTSGMLSGDTWQPGADPVIPAGYTLEKIPVNRDREWLPQVSEDEGDHDPSIGGWTRLPRGFHRDPGIKDAKENPFTPNPMDERPRGNPTRFEMRRLREMLGALVTLGPTSDPSSWGGNERGGRVGTISQAAVDLLRTGGVTDPVPYGDGAGGRGIPTAFRGARPRRPTSDDPNKF